MFATLQRPTIHPSHQPLASLEAQREQPLPSQGIGLRLRTETRTTHQRIERAPMLAQLFESDFSLTHYRELLARLYGYYVVLEERLFADSATLHSALAQRNKAYLIAQDLIALGLDGPAIAALPRCHALPACASAAQHLGVFYVLEGATLGAQVIRKKLRQHFGDEVSRALSFYGCYGERVAARWREFQAVLAAHEAAHPADTDAVVAAANETFASLTQWLEDVGFV